MLLWGWLPPVLSVVNVWLWSPSDDVLKSGLSLSMAPFEPEWVLFVS